jgi:hypothetical protein
LAASTAAEMIRHDPNYAGGYYALGMVAEHNGDKAKARQNFAMAEKFWSKADKDLPEIKRIRGTASAQH